MIDNISFTFRNMMDNLIMEIPNVIKALLLLLLAWGVAVLARALFQKVFVKIGVSRALSRTPLVQDEAEGERILESIGKLIYFLVFILFLPAVFNALNMTEVSTPISNMMNKFLEFIPSLIAAAIILIIGVFIARLVKELFSKFFATLNLDKWFRKVNPEKAEHATTQNTLSNVLANIIYIIILIPFITISIEALNIETISTPIQSVLNDVLAIIPNIFVAIILIIVGYYIGKLLGNLLTSLIEGTGINKIYQTLGITKDQKAAPFDLAKILGAIVHGLVVLFFTVEALHVINLRILNSIGYAVIEYLPYLLSAILILGTGLFLANVISNWIKNNTNSPLSAIIIKIVIITFSIFMTLDQLHFATSIVNKAFLLILGGLMVAFALSFGIGGRDFAKNRLEKFEKKLDQDKTE